MRTRNRVQNRCRRGDDPTTKFLGTLPPPCRNPLALSHICASGTRLSGPAERESQKVSQPQLPNPRTQASLFDHTWLAWECAQISAPHASHEHPCWPTKAPSMRHIHSTQCRALDLPEEMETPPPSGTSRQVGCDVDCLVFDGALLVSSFAHLRLLLTFTMFAAHKWQPSGRPGKCGLRTACRRRHGCPLHWPLTTDSIKAPLAVGHRVRHPGP